MNIQQIRESVSNVGLNATAQDLAYRGANKVTEVMILKGVVPASCRVGGGDVAGFEEPGEKTLGEIERLLGAAHSSKEAINGVPVDGAKHRKRLARPAPRGEDHLPVGRLELPRALGPEGRLVAHHTPLLQRL